MLSTFIAPLRQYQVSVRGTEGELNDRTIKHQLITGLPVAFISSKQHILDRPSQDASLQHTIDTLLEHESTVITTATQNQAPSAALTTTSGGNNKEFRGSRGGYRRRGRFWGRGRGARGRGGTGSYTYYNKDRQWYYCLEYGHAINDYELKKKADEFGQKSAEKGIQQGQQPN